MDAAASYPAGLLAGLMALALLGSALPARAEEPRDAIKRLPDLTHQSTFETFAADGSQGQSRQEDNYLGSWDLDWYPGTVALAGGVRVTPSISYTQYLNDRHDRLSRGGTDSRADSFDFQLRLEQDQRLQSSFAWHREDRFSGNPGSSLRPDMQVADSRSFNIAINQLNLPALSISGVSSSNYSSALDGQTGSDYDKLRYGLDFGRDWQTAAMRARMEAESWRSRIYRDGSVNSGDRSFAEASQRLRLGAIGDLNMNYYFEEVSQISSGSIEPSRVASSRFSLNLQGSLNISRGKYASPLSYGTSYANYTNQTVSGAANTTLGRVERSFNFRLNAPVPEGKLAQFSYATAFGEDQQTDRRNTSVNQDMRWDFKPNKLTDAGASYYQQRDTDELQRLRNKEYDRVQTYLTYRIPGNRGSVSSVYTLASERYPSTLREINSTELRLTNSLTFGPRASLLFSYTQNYSDTENSLFRETGNDYSRAAVQYRLSTPDRINLDATWSQQTNRYFPGTTKRDIQGIALGLSYSAANNWSYALRLDSSDEHEQSDSSGIYRSGEQMQAIVTYTF
ncbi:hypothetical protein IT575_06610 [bacterium]|nr:hypothetical protein [bacterium]